MEDRSKSETYDTFVWINSIIKSCTSSEQLETTRNLINNYQKASAPEAIITTLRYNIQQHSMTLVHASND